MRVSGTPRGVFGTRCIVAATAAVLACFVLPALANADRFHGTYQHHRHDVVLITGKSAEPKGITFRQWHAACSQHRDVYYKFTSSFVRPFKISGKSFFHDNGAIPLKRSGAYTGKAHVAVTGKRISAHKWSGTFKSVVKIKRRGHRYNECKTGTLRWTARKHG